MKKQWLPIVTAHNRAGAGFTPGLRVLADVLSITPGVKKGVISKDGEKNIRQAKEYTWILSDEILANSVSVLADKMKGKFDLRIVLPEGKFPSESVSRLPLSLGIQKRVLEKVNVLIVLTEDYSIFCLPNKNGKIDYTGFVGKDVEFHNWCRELFLYYWAKAKPLVN